MFLVEDLPKVNLRDSVAVQTRVVFSIGDPCVGHSQLGTHYKYQSRRIERC